ncbi:MAG: hypothetical protein CSA81_10075 [Acidobacteria bacterium]|nr:MAG: hypothetical protein CSA81_10075 [Acidobacteriota bacterium]PIE90783.1 MAG: hypothetical protein CR997_03930 [Acidobacteriota bacterium]
MKHLNLKKSFSRSEYNEKKEPTISITMPDRTSKSTLNRDPEPKGTAKEGAFQPFRTWPIVTQEAAFLTDYFFKKRYLQF